MVFAPKIHLLVPIVKQAFMRGAETILLGLQGAQPEYRPSNGQLDSDPRYVYSCLASVSQQNSPLQRTSAGIHTIYQR